MGITPRHIAVIGTGPTALDWRAHEDISIGVNAAVTLPFPLTYWMAIDERVADSDYWHETNGIRFVGNALRPREYRPHIPFVTVMHESPDLDALTMGMRGSVAHPALELAYRMGATEITLYGIDMGKRRYFAGPELGGTYAGIRAHGIVVTYMQAMIDLIRIRHVIVNIRGSEDCRLS